MDLLRCLGCDSVSARRDKYCSDPAIVYPEEGWGTDLDDSAGRHDVDYWPAPTQRAAPDWMYQLENQSFREALIETYAAFNSNLVILAAAGTRIAFDLLSFKLLGKDAGNFIQKLDALIENGHISEKQKETLHAVVDAGSAAQHRAHKIPHYDLKKILAILEGLIYQTVLAGEEAASIKSRTPSRPSTSRSLKKGTSAPVQ